MQYAFTYQTGLVPIFITKTFPWKTLQKVLGNSLASIQTIACNALASCLLRELTNFGTGIMEPLTDPKAHPVNG